MNRRSPFLLGLLGLGVLLPSCDYGTGPTPPASLRDYIGPLPTTPGRSVSPAPAADPGAAPGELSDQEKKRREAILNNVVKLMQTGATNPGGEHIKIATDHLNELFEQGTTPADYAMSPAARDLLARKFPELTRQPADALIQALQKPTFTNKDARHIEDCMLYHVVATRVAGEGDDLTRVRRIFDWMVRQVQLVPAGSLSGNGLAQAEVRPIDALFRGMATEQGGRWSERGWLFMALCRQIGVDVGILTYTPRRVSGLGPASDPASRPVAAWLCAAAIGDKAYLFDARIGLPIPGPDGTGVATLEEAIADPVVLDRLELPGQESYWTTRADLASSPTRIGVLIDSSLGYLSPRMRLLQGQLRGDFKTTLFRDPAEQSARFAEALGPRFGGITLWELPIKVETLLFGDPDFVTATQMSLRFFDGRLPLLLARTAQLRGDLAEAIDKMVALRFAENPVMNNKEKTPIPPEVQRGLDVYATYFLAQCQLDRGNVDQAEYLFRKLLDIVPDPGPGRNFYYMLRWGVQANLGRICESKGDAAGAIDFFTRADATTQHLGNLLRARDLVWKDPLAAPTPPPPPAPADPAAPIRAASAP